MGKAEMVIARKDVLSKLIADNHISKRAFSAKFGYTESWIGGVLRDGRIKPMIARNIAKEFGIPYETLVEVADSPIVKGAGLTSIEAEFIRSKIDEALKLIEEVKEMIAGAR